VNVAQCVGATLARLGVSHVFGVVGSGNFHLTNAMVAAGARFVAARHEGGATTMADAYARMSGSVCAVSVHQGCGFTNTLTGLAEAAKSRTPMVVLAADVTDARSNFAVDQDALAVAVGAVPLRIGVAGDASAVTRQAFHIARDERRTVVLNVPLAVPRDRMTRCPIDSATWSRRCAAPSDRSSSPVGERAGQGAVPRWNSWPRPPAHCWRRARWRRGSSTTTPGPWMSPAASPPRWRPN
jgi:thiamine pyrophosphate-dependent acetolactate synthase large subunit-like protein